MAPHEHEQFEDSRLHLRNVWHLFHGDKQVAKPVVRDRQGFRKRPPKAKVAITLTIGAILTALAGIIVRHANRK